MDLDLDIDRPMIGRKSQRLSAEPVRNLTEADLALLDTERAIKPSHISRISDRHHALARALATGASVADACAITGYTASRVSILRGDPSFEELISFYRNENAAPVRDLSDKLLSISNDAVSILQERLEDEPETLDAATLIDIAKFGADRSGHGPQSKTTNVNLHFNMADRLKAARGRMIDGKPSPVDGAELIPPAPLRRIAGE